MPFYIIIAIAEYRKDEIEIKSSNPNFNLQELELRPLSAKVHNQVVPCSLDSV